MEISVLKSIATIAERVAPTLAGILTGGASTEVTTVISLLCNLFGANPQNPNELIQKMNDDADRDAKLVQFELDYKSRLAETNEKDRESARQMNNAIGMREFLVVVLLIGLPADIWFYFNSTDPDFRHACLLGLLGLGKLTQKIYDLYFGSNKE